MDYQKDFDTWKERISNIPEDEVRTPHQPVDNFTGYAETLAVDAEADKDLLIAAGMDGSLIEELPVLTKAVRYAQAVWMSEYRSQANATKLWLEKSPAAYDFRDELLHHYKFAYRDDKNTLAKVRRINDGDGHKDLIQDLLDLAVLGDRFPTQLNNIKFDMSKIAKAKSMSREISELLALSNGSKDELSSNKLTRDKAYTLLYQYVSTIREFGKYVFWKNEKRREKYMANYVA
jgi:hypothetical protein